MRLRRCRRPDEAAAERLLERAATHHTGDPAEPIVRLLAAAAAPASAHELAGEDAALAAFRQARTSGTTPVPPRRRVHGWTAAWLAGLAVTATAGVAVAAAGLGPPGPVPTPSVTPSNSTTGTAPGDSGPPPGAPTPTGVPDPRPGPGEDGRTPNDRQLGDSEAALPGRCAAYLAQTSSERTRSLRSGTFRDLVESAGGTARVEAYCQQLVPAPGAAPTRRSAPADPADPASGSVRPSSPPTARPTARR